jgi:tetratricopeptide (TPR) repeat protein
MARLSSLYSIEGLYGYGAAHDVMPLSRAAAAQALALDDTLAEAHSAAGLVSSLYDWDWTAAERHFRRALELNSGQPEIHRCYAFFFLAPTGRAAEAVETVRRAKLLDPLSLILNASECLALLWAGQFDESIACGLRALELGHDYYMTHSYLAQGYMACGHRKEALEHARIAVRCSGGAPIAYRELGAVLAGSEQRAEAMRVAEDLINRQPVPYSMIADIHVALGDFDTAFHWFGEACRAHCSLLTLAVVRTANRVISQDQRFRDLVREMGLEGFATGPTPSGPAR